MSSTPPQLDHVILLLPYKDITDPPPWLTDNFVVSPGGRHADGKTENKLVLFRDGTYLELIAFIDDDAAKRRGHWWDKPFGVVDFAFTTQESTPDFSVINARLADTHSGVSYDEPKLGGRTRPDGVQLEWKVTFPKGAERGSVPFWCHDVTPRQRRVPLSEAAVAHPCGAYGMAGVRVEVEAGRIESLSSALAAIVDVPETQDWKYAVDTPLQIAGLKKPTVRFRAREGTESGLALALVCQTPHRNPPADIRHDGVTIIFETS